MLYGRARKDKNSAANTTNSYLHDSITDLQRCPAGVSPLNASANPYITAFTLDGGGIKVSLSFASGPSHLYSLEYTTDLGNGITRTDSARGSGFAVVATRFQ